MRHRHWGQQSESGAAITRHAQRRSQQRGIRNHHRDLLFAYGDRESPAGGGLYRLMFSPNRLRRLVETGVISRQESEKCGRLILITDGVSVVTNYRMAA